MTRTDAIALALILAAALVFRIVFSAAVVGFHAPLKGDAAEYHQLAVSLSEGRGFTLGGGEPTAKRPPLYPLLLAGIYRVFGPLPEAGRVLQIVLGVGLTALTFALARRLFPGRTALLAAAVAACNPFLIFISAYLLTENLYMCLTLSVMLMTVGVLDSPPRRRAVYAAAGLAAGLAMLARPTALLFVAATGAIILIWARGPRTRRLAGAALFAAVAAAAVVVWSARNRAAMGETVLFTTHGGHTFYQGNNDLVYREPGYRGGVAPEELLPGWERIREAGEVRGDRLAREMGLRYMREHPGRFVELAASRFARTWRFRSDVGLSGVKSGWWWDKNRFLGGLASTLDVGFLFSAVTIPLFVIGVAATARRARLMTPLYALILAQTATGMIFFGSLRMRIPAEPAIAIFAAAGIVALFDLARRPGGGRYSNLSGGRRSGT